MSASIRAQGANLPYQVRASVSGNLTRNLIEVLRQELDRKLISPTRRLEGRLNCMNSLSTEIAIGRNSRHFVTVYERLCSSEIRASISDRLVVEGKTVIEAVREIVANSANCVEIKSSILTDPVQSTSQTDSGREGTDWTCAFQEFIVETSQLPSEQILKPCVQQRSSQDGAGALRLGVHPLKKGIGIESTHGLVYVFSLFGEVGRRTASAPPLSRSTVCINTRARCGAMDDRDRLRLQFIRTSSSPRLGNQFRFCKCVACGADLWGLIRFALRLVTARTERGAHSV